MNKTAFGFLWTSVAIRAIYICLISVVTLFQDTFWNIFNPYSNFANANILYSLIRLCVPVLSLIIMIILAITITLTNNYHSYNKIPEIIGCIYCSGIFSLITHLFDMFFTPYVARIAGAAELAKFSFLSNITAWLSPLSAISSTLFIIACVTLFIYKKQQKNQADEDILYNNYEADDDFQG